MKSIDKLGISPTPWEAVSEYGQVLSGESKDTVANCDTLSYFRRSESDANARLIAAAPDCYEALRTAVNVIEEVLGSEDMQANCHNGTVFKLSVCKQKMIEALEKASGEDQNEVNA